MRVPTEVERVMQTRSNASPAPSVDPTRATQEDLQEWRLELRLHSRRFPSVPNEGGTTARAGVPTSPPGLVSSRYTTVFSTMLNKVKPGAIHVEISESDQWKPGDVAILHNQEAKTVRHIGSLVFDSPLQNGYDEGVEVRS